jgi:Ca2+-binding EF-hand superfamily protein
MDRLEKTATAIDAQAEALTHKFVDMCKRASIEYGGLRPVLQLAGYASEDKDTFSKIASVVTSALRGSVTEGEFVDTLPNKNHSIYKAYSELESTIKLASKHKAGVINAARMHEEVKSSEYV